MPILELPCRGATGKERTMDSLIDLDLFRHWTARVGIAEVLQALETICQDKADKPWTKLANQLTLLAREAKQLENKGAWQFKLSA
jgi:hypothetical protein